MDPAESEIRLDSPIEAILYCEFDTTAGPVILHQTPNGYVTKEQFDTLSNYLIPKPELERRLQTISALGLKIIGYPIGIDNARYSRNRLIFNVCFVCRPHLRTFHYENLVKKINNYFETSEIESQYLSNPETRVKIPDIIEEIHLRLNERGSCQIELTSSTIINLQVVNVHPDPEEVQDEQVPEFVNIDWISPIRWDLTTQQVLPYIDGFRHISRIATETGVEINLLKNCIRNLIYYGIVKLTPIFCYASSYLPTQKLVELFENQQLRRDCIDYVARFPGAPDLLPDFRSIFKMYCSMNYGITVRDLCNNFNPAQLNIDERMLIKFGLMKGLIRRIHRYPVLLKDGENSSNENGGMSRILELNSGLFDGNHSYDHICCNVARQNLNTDELADEVERNFSIVSIYK